MYFVALYGSKLVLNKNGILGRDIDICGQGFNRLKWYSTERCILHLNDMHVSCMYHVVTKIKEMNLKRSTSIWCMKFMSDIICE